MSSLNGLKILVGVSGGIAAYKVPLLVRMLRNHGADVRVVLTDSAKHFVSPLVLQALTGHPVESDWFDSQAEHGMGHIELARWADFMIIAPATANILAKIANGFADDLLSAVVLATTVPVWVCPAMNRVMWEKPAVQRNLEQLVRDGFRMIGPESGAQACGEIGLGRMSEPELIVKTLLDDRCKERDWIKDLKVVITAGPTFEPIDPVRFIGNRSSGKMGYAIAEMCRLHGARVILITGPVSIAPPPGIEVVPVLTACEMLEAADKACEAADILFSVAAVGDFSVSEVATKKLKKKDIPDLKLELVQNPDVVKTLKERHPGIFAVGFAAESEHLAENAQLKLAAKGLNMIAANNITQAGMGFGSDMNQLLVFDGVEFFELGPTSKSDLAEKLLDLVKKSYSAHGR